MNVTASIWCQFIVSTALIGAAGFKLSRYGDAIAQRTGLSGSLIGHFGDIKLIELPFQGIKD